MGRHCACTIITPSHLRPALALEHSLRRFRQLPFHILVVTDESLPREYLALADEYPHVKIHQIEDIHEPAQVERVRTRFEADVDTLRWASKPSLMLHLLRHEGYDGVLYLDSDLYFFDDYSFLLAALDEHAVLLSPHWRPIYPEQDEMQFHCNFRDGLYNAGFLGASQRGIPALEWWERACWYSCERYGKGGIYADQNYLDVFPLYFQGVHVLRHRGCNVAEWNRVLSSRSERQGRVWIADRWPLVFAHFTGLTMQYIDEGMDPGLERPLAEYRLTLSEMNDFVHGGLHAS